MGAAGSTGPAGNPGADGALRIYGDGSAGAVALVAGGPGLGSLAPNYNFQFTDFSVGAGVFLTLQPGTVIRCSGTFTNHGTITVTAYAQGAFWAGARPAHPGISAGPAGNGEQCAPGNSCNPGFEAAPIDAFAAAVLVRPGAVGGGGGGTVPIDTNPAGQEGGGTLVVIARGAIVQSGTITTNGGNFALGSGNGGAAGGVLVMASQTSITNSGTLSAIGRPGGGSSSTNGPGGGGGGGIVNLISPVISNTGTVTVAGGAAGPQGAAGSVTSTVVRAGGGAGGSSGGRGGRGGNVSASGTPGAAGAGSTGHFFSRLLEPTSQF